MKNDVFSDLGFSKEKSGDLKKRTILIDYIRLIVDKHGYTQQELMIILSQKQPEINYLLNGNISRFSTEKLLRFLELLDAEVVFQVNLPKCKIAI